MQNFNVKSLQVVTHNGQRVLTTEQLAKAYGCDVVRIQQNFHNNKSRFQEGKHYFKLEGESLRKFKRYLDNIELPINKFTPSLFLWTERGAARHSKILDTDMAWDIFDMLESNYFNPREVAKPTRKPDSYEIDDPVARASRWIEERQAYEAVEAKVKELEPKAEMYDTFIDKNGTTGIRDLCNELGITTTRLAQIFKEYKIAYKMPDGKFWKPYRTAIDQGFVIVRDGVASTGFVYAQLRITMKGKEFIAAIAKCEKLLPPAEIKTPANVISFPDPMKAAHPFDDLEDDYEENPYSC